MIRICVDSPTRAGSSHQEKFSQAFSIACDRIAEPDREAIIKAVDAMIIKHQTRQIVEEIEW
jgi:hypothetical protein